eukprot:12198634-Ditylum_brightwellii.AAC.1
MVEAYLRLVAQIHTGMEVKDPRVNKLGKLNFCLASQLNTFMKEDPAPCCVHPISLTLTIYTVEKLYGASAYNNTICNLLVIAFFFLL